MCLHTRLCAFWSFQPICLRLLRRFSVQAELIEQLEKIVTKLDTLSAVRRGIPPGQPWRLKEGGGGDENQPGATTVTPLDDWGRPLHIEVDETKFAGPPLNTDSIPRAGKKALRLLAQPTSS